MFTNPFPRTTPKGRVVLDEMCSCGAKRTEHGPGPMGGFGHGPCGRTGCRQFTWVAMVYADATEAPRRSRGRK